MNNKEKVIAEIKQFAKYVHENPKWAMSAGTLESWAWVLERGDEQQTPPVAIGEPRSGESSVQPGATLCGLTEMYCNLRQWQISLPATGDVLMRQQVGRICNEMDRLFDLAEQKDNAD